jgi:phage-related baseplate assembly protein
MRTQPPVLEPRSEDAIARELTAEAPAFAPAWQPTLGPGAAVIRVFARFAKALADRINAAPDKNRLAFFEQLGIELIPAQAARAPVVFEPLPVIGNQRVPARTRLGAQISSEAEPLVFETEQSIALAAAPLVEVVSLWPARDSYADHSSAVAARIPFTLFDPLQPVPHEFYLAHDPVLALAGLSTVELDFDLATSGSAALAIEWDYWDGVMWRGFKPMKATGKATAKDSLDATKGMTRSGVIRLVSECASSEPTAVNGVTASWIRGRLTGPLPPDQGTLPHIAQLAMRTTIDRTLPAAACAVLGEKAGLLPDHGIGAVNTLDFTKAVQPLGAQPQAGDAFYLACDEPFAKPGAQVTICFEKLETAAEVIDQHDAEYEEDANNAERTVLQAALAAADAVLFAGESVRGILVTDSVTTNLLDTELGKALTNLWNAVLTAKSELTDAINNNRGTDLEKFVDPLAEPARTVAYWIWNVNSYATQVEPQPTAPLPLSPNTAPLHGEANLENPPELSGSEPFPNQWPWPWGHTPFVSATLSELQQAAEFHPDPLANQLKVFLDHNVPRVKKAGVFARDAGLRANLALERLDTLTPIDAVRASGIKAPQMPAPVIAWEYWEGTRWRTLSVQGTADARTLRGDGPVTFDVPEDIEETEVSGTKARWIRARLVEGGFGTVRLVSWRDEKTQRLNFFPIVQVRPPTLDKVRYGYRYRSPRVAPDHCFAYNDFRFIDRTIALREPSEPFRPFEPVEDRTPTLYLGFDGALPADRVTVYAGIEEVLGEESGPPVVWEAWNGAGWTVLEADDETAGFALPGIVAVQWPGAVVDPGSLARFGAERWWLRARLASDSAPRKSTVQVLRPNAVWAAHHETLENQRLGSSTGQPEQVLFTRIRPVLQEEVLEVRELQGARAHVEEPILRAELELAGIRGADVRIEKDIRTGRTNAVWVRWRRRPTLLCSPLGAREYAIEHSRGRVLFGGAKQGRIPPPGNDNIRFLTSRTGGGVRGNVANGAITPLLAGVLAKGVRNELPADGGADVETLDRLRLRAPTVLRTRSQAIAADDYESLALQASPAVAVVRALPNTHPTGRHAPGWVTVRIVPHSSDARPLASFELRKRVRQYLSARAPAAIASHITVLPAEYFAVGVFAVIRAVDSQNAARARERAIAELQSFLHPLTGGPEKLGWPFGRDVHLSDIAALLEGLAEVDYVETLMLENAGTPVGDFMSIPRERMVVSGPLRVTLAGAET